LIDLSPIVTISFLCLIFNLTKGLTFDFDFLISILEKPSMDRINAMASSSFISSPEMVPLIPSSPTKIVP